MRRNRNAWGWEMLLVGMVIGRASAWALMAACSPSLRSSPAFSCASFTCASSKLTTFRRRIAPRPEKSLQMQFGRGLYDLEGFKEGQAVGQILELDAANVAEVQAGLKQCMAAGNRVIELEVPTKDRFKDAALNQIYEANTIYARDLVRMFTQPQELCMVFPDVQEAQFALKEYGGQVPFKLSSLAKPKAQGEAVDKYVVMHPVFDVREYAQMDQLYSDEIKPKDATLIIFNGDLFKLRSGGLKGYYPDIFFPKLADVRRRLMPQVETAYYFRIFRGPPVGALYKKFPGPWMVLRALSGKSFDVLAQFDQKEPPSQDDVFQILQRAGPAPVTAQQDGDGDEQVD